MLCSKLSYGDVTARLSTHRDDTIAICIPTVDEAATIGPICEALVAVREAGAIDRVIVMDDSDDETATLAEQAGAEVIAQSGVCRAFGAVRGKGDALWRALAVVDEDVVAFVDGDSVGFDHRLATDLIAAVALDGFQYAKATYRRPFASHGVVIPTGGGRVTELTAKPLLAALHPELGAFRQPLAGEFAARTALLRTLPFATGYAVDVALLIDVWRAVGLPEMVEVDTGCRQNRHRPLHELGAMAREVATAILDRAGVASHGQPLIERPPMATVAGRPLTGFLAGMAQVPEAAC